MPGKLILPSSGDFCRFVEAYFADVEYTKDTKSKAGHDVYRIPGHPHNIAVPRNRDRLIDITFQGLLEDMGINRTTYRKLAGTREMLDAYYKQRVRQARAAE